MNINAKASRKEIEATLRLANLITTMRGELDNTIIVKFLSIAILASAFNRPADKTWSDWEVRLYDFFNSVKARAKEQKKAIFDQTIPARRTAGEMIEILSQYPPDTLVSGSSNNMFGYDCIVQENSPDGILNNVGIYFW